MLRTKLSWLLLGGMGIALCACGDSGSPTGLPPAGFGYGSDEGPYGSFNEPPTSDNEMATSFNEGVGCGAEQQVALSDLLMDISLPLCKFEASCYDTEYPGGGPGQGGVTPNDGTMQTRDLSSALSDIPDFCLELAFSRTGGGQDADNCELTEALAHVAKEVPACEQHMVLPAGYCMARIDRCFSDIFQAGCASYVSGIYPLSCGGIIESDEPTDPQPVPDQPNN
jgi:hypothetical protein